MSTVIEGLRSYLSERLEQAGAVLRKNHISDHNVYRITTVRYLELEDILAKISELEADADCESDGWVDCDDALPECNGVYLCTYFDRDSDVRSCDFGYFTKNYEDRKWDLERGYARHNNKVIAWRKIKPYEKPVL